MTNNAIVRCRCGHQVLAKEVLRTDLYERSMGREYVYVKYRCRRCKRMGEAFVAESRWDWSILEAAHNEMSDSERDQFLDADAISAEEVLDFHRQLEDVNSYIELQKLTPIEKAETEKTEAELAAEDTQDDAVEAEAAPGLLSEVESEGEGTLEADADAEKRDTGPPVSDGDSLSPV